MGVHARRAARRRTAPLVAAAAGIGTVAAMLASPLPASAASYIADPTYGKTSTTDANVDRAARGGFTDTLGIGAVNIGANRFVLGQRQGGSDPRPIRVTKFDSTGNLDTTWNSTGVSTIIPGTSNTIPASFTATHLLTDGTNLYVVGYADVSNAWVAVSFKVAGADGSFTASGWGTAGVSTLTTGLSDTTYPNGFTIADAALNAAGKLAVETMAWSTGGAHDNRIALLTTAGVLDTATYTSGSPVGWAALPSGIASAPAVGGIGWLASGKLAGTAQLPGTASDSVSAVFQLTTAGAADGSFGTGGVSTALETVFDNRSWSNEFLSDVMEDPNTANSLVVLGRGGSRIFLGRLTSAGVADTTFNDTGVSDTLMSNCSDGSPEFTYSTYAAPSGRYWVSNDCGSTGEVFRFRASGAADADFGNGGMVRISGSDFGFDGSATAEPVTFDTTNNYAIVGASTVSTVVSQPQYDIAGWRIVQQTAASITTQPTSVSVNTGASPTFTVVATGSPAPTYQWQWAAPGSDNWSNVSDGFGTTGSTTATLTVASVVAAQNGTRYRVGVSNGGPVLWSSPATLAINGTPQIISQPANRSVAADTQNVTFTASYSGTAPITSNWQWRPDDHSDWAPVAGGNYTISSGTGTATLNVNRAMSTLDGTQFRVMLSNTLGQMTSMPAILQVTGGSHPTPPPPSSKAKPRGDYDGDGKTDIATFTPSTGAFNFQSGTKPFGKPGDIPMVGNYEKSDAASDMTVFRPSDGTWRVGTNAPVPFGRSTDMPVAGDFNGDGVNDPAVFRPSNGTWYIQGMDPVSFGRSTDIPVAADYNGDGKTDIAVFRPSNGTWYFWGGDPVAYGRSTDMPVMGDFNGDGKADVAVFRPSNGTWYINGMDPVAFGRATDIPLSGDFNGDGKTDVAVYRPSNTTWYFWGGNSVQFGKPGDWPLPRG